MEIHLQVTEEELLEFPEVRSDLISLILVIQIHQPVKLFSVKRKVASVAVEAVEGVVPIHTPILKLKNHTINDQESRNRKIDV